MTVSVVGTGGAWATAIRSAWHKSVEGIIECGRLLCEAKAALPHGEFGQMCAKELPFNTRIGQMLMAISNDERVLNAIHGSYLPTSYRTLYDLTRLNDEQWALAESRGLLRPDLERNEVAAIRKLDTRYTQVGATPSETTCTVGDLESLGACGQKFGTIYADPPWVYGNQATRASTGNHYDGLSVDDICALPVKALAADVAHLHLWTTNGFLFDAKRVMEAWGFEYRSCFVWVKPQMGIGNYWRVSHEFMLLGIRGSQTFLDKSLMSWGRFNRSQHSAKPEEIRQMVERASLGPRLELFGRRAVDGWTVWGNQIERNLFHQPDEVAA